MKSERFSLLNSVFIVLVGFNVVGTSSGGDARKTLCFERERQALLEFKQGLIDNSGILSSWGREDEKKECCSWKGVKCSNITGHVVVLDIQSTPQPIYIYSHQYLKGNITPSLLELQHLKYLDLSYNDFGGSRIPDFIGSFPRLEYLHLQNANLTGNNELCGPPLAKCLVADHNRINNLDEDDKILSFGFYVSMGSGFILGFWGVIFTLILKQSCRDAYFQLLTNIANWIFVTTIMSLRRLKMLWS